MSRVVVSGLGVVSPYGAGTKTFWAGLAAGTCAIRPITRSFSCPCTRSRWCSSTL